MKPFHRGHEESERVAATRGGNKAMEGWRRSGGSGAERKRQKAREREREEGKKRQYDNH